MKVKLTDALNSQLHVSFNGMTDSECEVKHNNFVEKSMRDLYNMSTNSIKITISQ